MVDQSHLGVVTVTGPDRLTWLNSITSQELTALRAAHVDRAAGAQPAGARRARGGRRRRRRDHLAAHRDADRAGRLAEPHEVHAAGRDRDATDDWAAIGEPVDAEGTPDEPVTWRDPWPTTAAGRHALRTGRRRAPRRRPRLAARAGPARPAGRGGARAGGRRLAARRHLGQRGRARRGVAPAGVPRGRPPDHPARARLAAHRRAPDTRAATAGRRPSRACTTSAGRRAGSSCCTSTAPGTCCPSPVPRCTTWSARADSQEPGPGGRAGHHRRAPPRARPGRARRGQAVGAGGRRARRRRARPGPSRPARSRSCPATACPWTGRPPADP